MARDAREAYWATRKGRRLRGRQGEGPAVTPAEAAEAAAMEAMAGMARTAWAPGQVQDLEASRMGPRQQPSLFFLGQGADLEAIPAPEGQAAARSNSMRSTLFW